MLVIAGLLLVAFQAPAAASRDTCVSCHTEIGGDLAAPVTKVKDDVHGKRGLSCASCHGGGF